MAAESGKKPRRAVRLAQSAGLLLASLLFTGVLAEGVVRVFLPQELSGSLRFADPWNIGFNRAGADVFHFSSGRKTHYRINSLGLRGAEPRQSRRRVLALGDSFTFGWLLEEPDTYISELQRRTDEAFGPGSIEWLNASAGGWGTANYLRFLEVQEEKLRPDFLVVFLSTRDISASATSHLYRLENPADFTLTLDRGQVTSESHLKKILRHIPGYYLVLEHSHLSQLVRRSITIAETERAAKLEKEKRMPAAQMPGKPGPHEDEQRIGHKMERPVGPSPSVKLGQALFLRLKSWAAKRGIPLVVVPTGFQEQVFASGNQLDPADHEFWKQAPAFFAREGIPFYGIDPEVEKKFRSDPGPYMFEDGHPTEKGAKWIAGHAWDHLKPLLAPLAH